MPRARQRVCLQTGLKLDLNDIARRGFVEVGGCRTSGISWHNSYTGEQITSGIIMADMTGPNEGLFRIQVGGLEQNVTLVSRALLRRATVVLRLP
jgi:hypothetical protein